MSYPCHYTNLCPHKPHKHAHTHTHTHTHTHKTIILIIHTIYIKIYACIFVILFISVSISESCSLAERVKGSARQKKKYLFLKKVFTFTQSFRHFYPERLTNEENRSNQTNKRATTCAEVSVSLMQYM